MIASNRANRQSHKNQIKRATFRRSMRQQAFMTFDLGMRPSDVARVLKLSQTTAFRYFQQWKKMPPLFNPKYGLAKRYFRKLGYNDRRRIAQTLAEELGTSEEEISEHLTKPWAIKQLVSGQWRQWPVSSTGGRPRSAFNTWLRKARQLNRPKEVTRILEMATNQSINPFQD